MKYTVDYYQKNRERIKARVAKYRAENPEKVKEAVQRCFADPEKAAKYKAKRAEWYKTYAPIARERARKWKLENPDRDNGNFRSKLYKLTKIRRKPCWLTRDDLWLMKEAYALAKLRSKVTGIDWHVDHIIPLRGKTVSGLHVPTNLRVITAEENFCKGNHFVEVP